MQDQVDEVKTKNDIVTIIGERVALSKAGKNFKANCPFHSEKTPSFIVSPDIQFYKCFGCGEHGDIFNFLEKYDGMEFYEALKYLAERVGIKLKTDVQQKRGIKEKLYEINMDIAKFYSYVLLSHPEGNSALKYLLNVRGVTMETIKNFDLGYCPDKQFAIKSYIIGKKKVDINDLEKTGIIYRNGNYVVDRFRGRLIFPLHDHRGNVCGFAGRQLPGMDLALAKYINTPDTPAYSKSGLLYGLNFTKNEIKKTDYAIIVEGELDMISSWQAGVKNAVAIKGSALTVEQLKLLSRYTKKIILALDSDFAGNVAARRGIEMADKEGFEIKVARLGEFKDPDEAARSAPDKYRKYIKESVPIWDFLIDNIFSKHSLDGSGKLHISREIIPVISTINDKIVQAHYVESVSKRLNIQTEAVYEQIKKEGVETKHPTINIENEKNTGDRLSLLEERLVSLLLSYNPYLLFENSNSSLVSSHFFKKIISHLYNFANENNSFALAKFVSNLPTEMRQRVGELILKASDLSEDRAGVYEKEVEIVRREMKIILIKKEIAGITEKMSREEKDKPKMKQLNSRFKVLTNKLSQLEEANHKGIILES